MATSDAAAEPTETLDEPAPSTPAPLLEARPPKPPREPRDPRPLGWRFVVPVVVGAIAADLALRRPPWNNVAVSVAIAVAVGGLLLSGRLVTRPSKIALAAAVVVAFFLWLRSNPELVVFNLLASLSLILYAVIHARGRSMWDSGPIRLLHRGMAAIAIGFESTIDSGLELEARLRRAKESGWLGGSVAGGLARGAVLAVPLLLVLGVLLASADAVFASFFETSVSVDLPWLLGHAILLALGAVAMVAALRIAGRDLETAAENENPFRLGRIEALVVLISVNVLFAGFAVAQLIALTGGADRVLDSAGLTFKEYARQGFFQLLWVAAITLVVLVALNSVTRHLDRGRREIVGASLITVVLTLLIVVVAFGRLRLYIGDDGLTPLRFYSSVFSVWIGVVFLMLAARLLGVRKDRNWLTTATGLSAVVFLIGLNIANPEAIIADNNLHRDDPAILYHMEQLTADGEIVLIDGVDRLSPDLRADVEAKLCRGTADYDYTGLGFNLAERRLADRCGR